VQNLKKRNGGFVVFSSAVLRLTISYVFRVRQIGGCLFQVSELHNDCLAMGGNCHGWLIDVFVIYYLVRCFEQILFPESISSSRIYVYKWPSTGQYTS
jgi:hypothetical protein